MEKKGKNAMKDIQYYEVEGAVFRQQPGKPMEVYGCRSHQWKPYQGDEFRVTRMSNPMSLDEVKPYMDEGQSVAA